MAKCVVDRRLKSLKTPCPGMLHASNGPYKQKGLRIALVVNLDTGAEKQMAMLHSGKSTKNGIVLNFCPFCGAKMSH